MSTETDTGSAPTPAKKKFEFPGAVTMLAIVTVLVWIAALFIPAGRFGVDVDGSPVPGSFETVTSPLSFWERIQQLILSPVNGLYGVQDSITGFVDTDNIGRLFGSVGVVLFIMALGAFISVSFATRSLETAVSQLATKLSDKGWLLITVIMVLFSLLGSTMGLLGRDVRLLRPAHTADDGTGLRPHGRGHHDHPRRSGRKHGVDRQSVLDRRRLR